MFVQTLNTPNPNSLKFLPGEKVSLSGPLEITDKNQTTNEFIRNILSVNGVNGIFLSDDFLTVNKDQDNNLSDFTVSKDSIIENNCHISTGVIVNGSCLIKEGTFVGSNATIVDSAVTKQGDFIKAGSLFKKIK